MNLMASMVALFWLIPLVCIPLLIAVYVYRDAKSRGMNAALWALVAALAPLLIGFIVYLLVRGSYPDLKCPSCGTPVTEQYVSCPNCGAKLKATCPSCAAPVEPDWKLCPRCAKPLPEQQTDFTAPIQKKDRMLGKILIAVILIPILLIVLLVAVNLTYSTSSGGTGVTSLTVDDYLQDVNNPKIEAWLDGLEVQDNHAYILEHRNQKGESIQVRYLIYLPGMAEMANISIGQHTGVFGNDLTLNIEDAPESDGNSFILVTTTWEIVPNLKLTFGGKPIAYTITEVDYPLGLTDGVVEAGDEALVVGSGDLVITEEK